MIHLMKWKFECAISTAGESMNAEVGIYVHYRMQNAECNAGDAEIRSY